MTKQLGGNMNKALVNAMLRFEAPRIHVVEMRNKDVFKYIEETMKSGFMPSFANNKHVL